MSYVPADLDPVTSTEDRLREEIGALKHQVECRDKRIADLEARIKRQGEEFRALQDKSDIIEAAIIVRDIAAKHGVTNRGTWKYIIAPEWPAAICDLIFEVNDSEF